MTEEEKLNARIEVLKQKIESLEAESGNISDDFKDGILEEIHMLNKILVGDLESLILSLRAKNVRNPSGFEMVFRKGFLHEASQYLNTRSPDAIASLASPEVLVEKEKYWVERAESAWHPLKRSAELRKAVYRFAKQKKHWE
jgi:hypothetical protein